MRKRPETSVHARNDSPARSALEPTGARRFARALVACAFATAGALAAPAAVEAQEPPPANCGLTISGATCTVGGPCQVDVVLAPNIEVVSVDAELAVPLPQMSCVGKCTEGSAAPTATCSQVEGSCDFNLTDFTLIPFSAGTIALLNVECNQPGTFAVDLVDGFEISNASANLTQNCFTPEPGQVICEAVAACGDGILDAGEQCDDGNTASGDCCSSTCTAETGSCDDNDLCTTVDQCSNGVCVGSDPPLCDDKNSCTNNGCSPEVGCRFTANTDPCDDGNACTTVDVCNNGQCTGSVPKSCDDGNICTADSCDTTTGDCSNTANTMVCDDGVACTESDTCTSGTCAGTAIDCSGLDGACSLGACNEATGQCEAQPINEGESCDDQDACTQTDVCTGGTCAGAAIDCTALDGACVVGVCNGSTGQCEAQTQGDGSMCDDGDACTTNDTCVAGTCTGGLAQSCDDGDICTADSCDTTSGLCSYTPNTMACDDNNVCTVDTCAENACTNTLIDADLDGFSTCDGDCDDDDPLRSPGLMEETCNDIDDDCNVETSDVPTGGCVTCVDVTLPERVRCLADRYCTVSVSLDAQGAQVASATATLDSTFAGLVCPDTTLDSATCEVGAQATNGICTANAQTCEFAVSDLSDPIAPFGDGELGRLRLLCQEVGFGQLCLAHVGAGTVLGFSTPTCGASCTNFDCSQCLSGDCNQTGDMDAGDPICSVLCLVGVSTAQADCSCAADCNCIGGVDAGDPVCTVLRVVGKFEPDTCDPFDTRPVPTLKIGDVDAAPADGPDLVMGKVRLSRKGRRVRTTMRAVGSAVDQAATVRATFWTGGPGSRVKLAPRLKRAGFTLQLEKQGGHAALLVLPPLRAPIAAMGKGRVLRVSQPVDSPALKVSHYEFGSTGGLPMP